MEDWRSLELDESEHAFQAREATVRFQALRLVERVLRAFGALGIVAGYLQWFAPASLGLMELTLSMRMLLTVAFVGTGFAFYLYAVRGSQRMIRLDRAARRVSVGRINSKNRSILTRHHGFDDIESFFVQRRRGQDQAALCFRPRGSTAAVVVLTGSSVELEALHAKISEGIQMSRACKPRRVVRSASAKSRNGALRPVRPVSIA